MITAIWVKSMRNTAGDSKYKSLFTNTIAFTISNFASKILVFLLIPLYTSVLSTKEYGIADLITNTINVLYPLLTLAIMEATLRFAFDSDVSKDEVLCNSLIIIGLSEVIIIILWPLIGHINSTLSLYWGWFSIIFLGHNLHQVLTQFTKGIGKTKVFAISGVIQTIVIILSNIIGLLFLKLGLNAYLFSIVAGYFLTVAYLIIASKIRLKSFTVNKALLKKMLAFSIPMIPNMVAWWVSTSADKYIITWYLGIPTSGIYGTSYKIPSIMTMFTSIFTSAWTIFAIENVNKKDNAKFHKTVYDLFNVANVLACMGLMLMSQFLARFLFKKDFFEAWHCVPMLLVAYVFAGLGGFMASSFRAAKYTKGLLGSTLIGAVVNIILNLFFIKHYGIMGAAFTTMLGFAVTFFIRSFSMKKILDMHINLIRDTLIYLILVINAFLISHEIQYSYIIGIISFAVIIFVYRSTIMTMLRKLMGILKTRLHFNS